MKKRTRKPSRGGQSVASLRRQLADARRTIEALLADQAGALQERERVQQVLRSGETWYRALTEHGMDLVVILDARGALLHASPSARGLLGYETGELLGRIGFDYLHPDDAPRIRQAFLRAAAGDTASIREEFRFRHKDGTWRTFEGVVANLLDDPTVRGIVVNCRDVTHQRSLERQLQQAQRLEAIGRLAGGVAHDFNNVLTAIDGYTALLLDDLAADDAKRQDVLEIRAAAQRAANLTRQLLAFSRKQLLQTRVLDLNEVVQAVERLLGRLIGEDIQLRIAASQAPAVVRADPSQIEQVILNLAVNARDAMPGGGTLTIETSHAELDESYTREHPGTSPGRYVLLSVTDSGIGMDAEVRSHLFEPFFTTKEPGKGTGLGLATAYGIVKQSGGSIWAYSEPGRGSTFKIYLPRVDLPVDAEAMEPQPGQPARGGRETVLLAEDDPAVRAAVSQALEHKGYTLLRAPDGQTALEIAAAHQGEIQLLITDMIMPGMTGRELAEALGAARPRVRVLYMSGYTDDAIVRLGVLQGDMPYVQKPFSPEALARRVREVLDQH